MALQDYDRELRLGVVLYGGVSLAIYIYGVVFELLRLVQTHVRGEGPYKEVLQAARVRPVIDVVSGTSAGGINGVFLAHALATGSTLEPLKELWINEGDLENLIDESREPRSLLRSDYYREKLAEAFRLVGEREQPAMVASSLLDLFVTATDLDGVITEHHTLCETTKGQGHRPEAEGLKSKRHATVFHFQTRPQRYHLAEGVGIDPQTVELLNRNRDRARADFTLSPESAHAGVRAEYLARVTAATSAFPVAFTPLAFSADDKSEMRHAFGPTVMPARGSDEPSVYGDGGMVDNKPFSYTLETIFRRQADLPVDRKLVFVEPDPEIFTRAPKDGADGIDSLIGYIGAATYESVTTDLENIDAQNQRIDKFVEFRNQLDAALGDFLKSNPGLNGYRTGYEEYPLYDVYRDLNRQLLLEDFEGQLRRAFADQARGELVASCAAELRALCKADGSRFLRHFNVPYRIRRLRYFIDKVNEALRLKQHDAGGIDALRKVKARLYVRVEYYSHSTWLIWDELRQESDISDGGAIVRYLENRFDALVSDAAKGEDRRLVEHALSAFRAAGVDLSAPIGAFDAFEFIDMHMFPAVTLAGAGEVDRMEVVRISPSDAGRYTRRIADKIAGEKFMHFSAFFKRAWRENDILWGRLDAAEIIVRQLLGLDGNHEKYLDAICPEIIREEWSQLLERRSRSLEQGLMTERACADIREDLNELAKHRLDAVGTMPGSDLEARFRELWKIGAEDLRNLQGGFVWRAGAKSLRALTRLLSRKLDKDGASVLQAIFGRPLAVLRSISETFYFVVFALGGDQAPVRRRLLSYGILALVLLLVLHFFGFIAIQSLFLWATAIFIVVCAATRSWIVRAVAAVALAAVGLLELHQRGSPWPQQLLEWLRATLGIG